MPEHHSTTEEDTIAAVASGVGGSISVLRLSGPDALTIANHVWRGKSPLSSTVARRLRLGHIYDSDGEVADQCLVAYMPGPRSYTGEDSVEIYCHGGAVVAQTILQLLLRAGARHADPGEFSKRAFINGKLDLTQAEAVLDVIESQSDMALRTANRQLRGALRDRVDEIYDELKEILAEIEVRMDFVDEDLDWHEPERILATLNSAVTRSQELLASRHDGELLRHGLRLVLAGAPNAGKSSLLNTILGRERAIVTDIPGTTRDSLEEMAHIRGIPIRVTDTAGIRESSDVVEQAGIERSRESIRHAQIVLWIIDSTVPMAEQQLAAELAGTERMIAVANKSDLASAVEEPEDLTMPWVEVSALTGEGIQALYDEIERLAWCRPHEHEPEFAVNTRHIHLLEQAVDHLESAADKVPSLEFELVAVSMRAALDALGKITGKSIEVDILDNIFSKFCIGK